MAEIIQVIIRILKETIALPMNVADSYERDYCVRD